jgi:hypothetical protein
MRLLRYAPSDSSTYFKYASGVLGRKPCIHIRLDLLATNPCEKCGLTRISHKICLRLDLIHNRHAPMVCDGLEFVRLQIRYRAMLRP